MSNGWQDYDDGATRQANRTVYRGEGGLGVRYERQLCMHAGECGRASKDVFDGGRHKWIEPDACTADELAAIVARCPTGALTLERDGVPVEEAVPAANTATVSPNGPLFLRGQIRIAGEDRVRTRVALCRCGASSVKPFCDNSHVRLRFKDGGAVARDPGEAVGQGVVEVTPIETGPLRVQGPVTLVAASGRAADTAERKFLCRCGNSKNKPYCDGSHSREGFRSLD